MLRFLLFLFIPIFAIAQPIQKQFAFLEASSGGRLGIAAINTANNQIIDYHAHARFPFCSTYKIMGVAAILKKEPQDLNEKIKYTKKDLASWSPVTEKNIAKGMTLAQLCNAALTVSDNTAINLLMKQLGGPTVVTNFARSIGDTKFNLTRWEPELNSAIPGDVRDTTTPAAMASSLQKLLLGNVLTAAERLRLQNWMKHNTTGDEKIRAGVPNGWVVADKTGSGDYGTTNDIGVIWPPYAAPIVLVIYSTQNKKDNKPDTVVIAAATRVIVRAFAKN